MERGASLLKISGGEGEGESSPALWGYHAELDAGDEGREFFLGTAWGQRWEGGEVMDGGSWMG